MQNYADNYIQNGKIEARRQDETSIFRQVAPTLKAVAYSKKKSNMFLVTLDVTILNKGVNGKPICTKKDIYNAILKFNLSHKQYVDQLVASKLIPPLNVLEKKIIKDNAAALVDIRKLVWAKEPQTKPKAKTVQQTGRGVQKAYKNICKEVLSSDIFYP